MLVPSSSPGPAHACVSGVGLLSEVDGGTRWLGFRPPKPIDKNAEHCVKPQRYSGEGAMGTWSMRLEGGNSVRFTSVTTGSTREPYGEIRTDPPKDEWYLKQPIDSSVTVGPFDETVIVYFEARWRDQGATGGSRIKATKKSGHSWRLEMDDTGNGVFDNWEVRATVLGS